SAGFQALAIFADERNNEAGIRVGARFHARSIPQIRPKFFRRLFRHALADWRKLLQSCRPIDFAWFFRFGWSERRKGRAVSSDRHWFAMVTPLRHIGKLLAQIAHRCSF